MNNVSIMAHKVKTVVMPNGKATGRSTYMNVLYDLAGLMVDWFKAWLMA